MFYSFMFLLFEYSFFLKLHKKNITHFFSTHRFQNSVYQIKVFSPKKCILSSIYYKSFYHTNHASYVFYEQKTIKNYLLILSFVRIFFIMKCIVYMWLIDRKICGQWTIYMFVLFFSLLFQLLNLIVYVLVK